MKICFFCYLLLSYTFCLITHVFCFKYSFNITRQTKRFAFVVLDSSQFVQGKDDQLPQHVNHGTLTAPCRPCDSARQHQVSPKDSSTVPPTSTNQYHQPANTPSAPFLHLYHLLICALCLLQYHHLTRIQIPVYRSAHCRAYIACLIFSTFLYFYHHIKIHLTQ